MILTKKSSFLGLAIFGCILFVSGCADVSKASPIQNPLPTIRWIVVGAIILAALVRIVIVSTRDTEMATNLLTEVPTSIITVLLVWTKLGEWGYMLTTWLVDLWFPLIFVIGFLNFVGGFFGNILPTLGITVLLGFVFTDKTLFNFLVIPAVVGIWVHVAMVALSGPSTNDKAKS